MILIVGGAGYIGSHVNKYITQKGYSTIVYDNLITGHKDFVKWGEFVLGDTSDREQLELVFATYPIEAVFYFAAFAYVGESVQDPQKYYKNNLQFTITLLEVMQKYGVKNFIFSSTCATYGIPQEIPIPEIHPQNPINPYGRSKLSVEWILEDYSRAYGLKYVSLRYFNAAGADPEGEIGERHNPETHLIPIILEVALKKRKVVKIFGTDYPTPDGTCIRDYIHVMDLAQAHWLGLEYLKNEKTSQVFNLGNGKGFSVKEVIETARKITQRDILAIPSSKRPGDPPILVGSSEKAKNILGWAPEFPDLDIIIQTAWKWHQKEN
jgi:UDP-glucose 4-epimerase